MANKASSQGVWNKITGWFDQNADKYLYELIPSERTDRRDVDTPIVADHSYFRLCLNEMFLKKSVSWGIERFPVVHAEVHIRSDHQQGVILNHLLQPVPDRGKGIALNYWLAGLRPYKGESVEMKAELLELQGNDYLKEATQVLQECSCLIQEPPLEQIITLASKVALGIRNLLSSAQGDVHLGLHQSFVSGGSGRPGITPGYFAVILATRTEIEVDKLFVKNDQLYYTPREFSQPEPFQGYDYMLFRIQGLAERDNWCLPNIIEPFEKAIEAWFEGNEKIATIYKNMALAAAWKSPDLIPADRIRAVKALKSQWEDIENEGRGAVGTEKLDLNTIIATRAISTAIANTIGELSAEEVFAE